MSFRRRLLIALALIVLVTVGSVSTVVSLRTRSSFERSDAERTIALVAQFRREFTRRGEDVVRRVEAIAAGESVSRMAMDEELSHGASSSAYVTEAKTVGDSHQLDLLEFVGPDGKIISASQWPARFGYQEDIASDLPARGAVLRLVPLPDGAALGLLAARVVNVGDKPLYILGGQRLDQEFISSLTLPAGMRALLYRNLQSGFSASSLMGPAGAVERAERLAPLIQRVQQQGTDADEIVQWSADAGDSESFHAIPLKGENDALLGVLLVGSSRRSLIELQRHIGAFALIVGGIGILLAVVLSSWVAGRVTRPIERLAEAARTVAAGNWNAQVAVTSQDEIGELAESFNSMTRQLVEQRDRAVQAERVAAWRELARRLAHELKNPLFPLQITVENLLRARKSSEFDEVFQESTATLLTELGNLKTIVGRFSDFSKMPQPQLQPVNLNDIARQVLKLHEAQLRECVIPSEGAQPPSRGTLRSDARVSIALRLALDESLPPIDADPDLLHRALSNLVLNALDAMSDSGILTVRTSATPEHVRIEISDTGSGLTKEECDRLFTPYYTTKRHGTGLGLAIVQSVVSDHHGSISVESAPGKGTTFRIDLPRTSSTSAASSDMFKSAILRRG